MNISRKDFISHCLKSLPTNEEGAEYLYNVYAGCVQIGEHESKASVIDLLEEWCDKMIEEFKINAASPIGFVLGSLENEVLDAHDIELLQKRNLKNMMSILGKGK